MKKSNGITLIALVVTIIILIILAGVGLGLVLGKEGLITKAKDARELYDIGTIKEQIELAKAGLQIQNKKITANNIKEYLVENNIYAEEEIQIQQKDQDNETIKIRKAKVDIPMKKVTLYFEKGESWSSAENIYAYVWGADEYCKWPGVKTELVEGTTNIYQYTVPEKYEGENIIFSNGLSMFKNDGIQTLDLKMGKSGQICRITNHESDRWIYVGVEGWSDLEKVKMYVWNKTTQEKKQAWPGENMEYVSRAENVYIYKYYIGEEYDMFIYSYDGKSQSKDLEFTSGGNKIYSSGLNKTEPRIGICSFAKWEDYKK